MYNKVEICGVNTATLKVLSEAEKMRLLREIRNGNRQAREQLVNGNLRLVLSVIQRFAGRGENPDDLFQVGCIGLIKAIDNFDAEQQVHLADFESLYGAELRAEYINLLVELNETVSYKLTGSKITGNTAEVTVDIACRDLTFALSEFYALWYEELAKYAANGRNLSGEEALGVSMKLALRAFGDDTLPIVSHERTVYLDLVNGSWTINTEKSEGFINSLVGGMVDGSLFGRQ